MGDNIYLGDRDGVRTPMQWSVDRNGGFSRVDPAKLFLPTIQDPIYGYLAVNVEAQLASPTSMLNWLRRMIVVRKAHRALGRGRLRFLYPKNRKVLAYLRELDDETILCVVNVSNAPQAVELDMEEFDGTGLTELTAGTKFPRIGELPYLLTLPAYGFYWFQVEKTDEDARYASSSYLPELFTLVATGRLESIFAGRERDAFEQTAAPAYLQTRRWFAAKGARIQKLTVDDFAVLRDGPRGRFILPLLTVAMAKGDEQAYFTPLAVESEHDDDEDLLPFAISRLRRGARMGLLYDADASPAFALAMLGALRRGEAIETDGGGTIRFSPSPLLADEPLIDVEHVRRMGAEQSNSSINLDDRMALKIYRRLQPGANPEVEIGRFLTDVAQFGNAPPTLGVVEYVDPEGVVTALAVLQRFVRNQGDAWSWTLDVLTRIMDALAFSSRQSRADLASQGFDSYTPHMRRLGARTAEMHKALACQTDDGAFAAEPLTLADVREAVRDASILADKAFAHLESMARQGHGGTLATRLLARKADCYDLLTSFAVEPVGAIKTRIHGDYHLGQVLVVKDDVVIIDFEGEPARTLDERRAKASPLRDVAGMLRSFAYAVATARRRIAQRLPEVGSRLNKELMEFSEIFIDAYMDSAKHSPIWIDDAATQRRLLLLFTLSKAFYEIDYEAGNRPEWIDIPIEGVLTILDYVAETV